MVPETLRGRYVLIILHVTSFIVYNYYTTQVLSSLIGTPVVTDIRNMQDLGDSSLKFYMDRAKHIESYLNVFYL